MSSNDSVLFFASENESASTLDENGEIIMEEDFETIHVEQQDVATIANQCAYVQKLLKVSKLHVLQSGNVKSAYKDHKECGLFHLFIKKSFLGTALRSWTNNHLVTDRKKEVSERKYLAYIELEMAMSIAQFNTVDEYWMRDNADWNWNSISFSKMTIF